MFMLPVIRDHIYTPFHMLAVIAVTCRVGQSRATMAPPNAHSGSRHDQAHSRRTNIHTPTLRQMQDTHSHNKRSQQKMMPKHTRTHTRIHTKTQSITRADMQHARAHILAVCRSRISIANHHQQQHSQIHADKSPPARAHARTGPPFECTDSSTRTDPYVTFTETDLTHKHALYSASSRVLSRVLPLLITKAACAITRAAGVTTRAAGVMTRTASSTCVMTMTA